MRLAVLGDSIAFGVGATSPGETLSERLVDGLAARGRVAVTRVVAVPGARTSALAGQVDQALAWEPDVAVVVIGANDLTHLEPLGSVVPAYRAALARLRAARIEVVVAPAPDLSSVPHVPAQLRTVVRQASESLRSQQVSAAVAEGARVADADGALSRAFAADRTLFSADRFHPSSAGYARIAAALLSELLLAVDAGERGEPDVTAHPA